VIETSKAAHGFKSREHWSLGRIASAVWYRCVARRRERGYRLRRIAKALIRRYGSRVISGPFCGLKYVDQAVCSSVTAKLIGCYEAELHGVIESIIASRYPVIVNIGAAEGYYAAGLASRLPDSLVYAFDSDPQALDLCTRIIAENGLTESVRLGGFCDVETLRRLPLARALIICDIEGYELDLLDPETVPELAHCDILVETHDFINPDVSKILLRRFQSSHDAVIVTTMERSVMDYPATAFLRDADRNLALQDGRVAPQEWVFFTAKDRAKPNGLD